MIEYLDLSPVEILKRLKMEFPEYNFDSKSRKTEVVYIRAIYYKYAYRKGVFSYSYIGSLFENPRDHATILHGLKLFNENIQSKDKYFKYFHDRAFKTLKYGYSENFHDDTISRQSNYIKVLSNRIDKLEKEIEKINKKLK